MQIHGTTETATRRALVLLLLGAAGISLAPIFVRLSEIGPSATAFHRLALALPVLWIWAARPAGGGVPDAGSVSLTARDRWVLVLAGIFFAGDLTLWHWSIRLTSVANSTLLANFAPIFVTLGSFLLFGERFSRTFLVGLTAAVTGVVLLFGDSLMGESRHLLGDGLGVGTAMFYAAYIVTVSRLRRRLPTRLIMAWSSAVAALVMIPVTWASGESFLAASLFGWAVLIGLALISHAGGQSLIAFALAHLSAAFGSVGLLLQPVLAATIAWFLFGEALSPLQFLGGTVVLLGIYLSHKGSQSGRPPSPRVDSAGRGEQGAPSTI